METLPPEAPTVTTDLPHPPGETAEPKTEPKEATATLDLRDLAVWADGDQKTFLHRWPDPVLVLPNPTLNAVPRSLREGSTDELLMRRPMNAQEPPELDPGALVFSLRASRIGSSAVRIGRSSECDVRIPSSAISRFHVVVTRTPDGGYWIEDLGSRNGTILNGEAVLRGRPQPLEDDALVVLGDCELVFLTPAGLYEELKRWGKREARTPSRPPVGTRETLPG